jgi:malonyl-CoA O-methyltransferase
MGSDFSSLLDKRLVRLSFERAATSYDQAAVLQREVAQRMFERLDYVKLTPRVVLDAGAGTGFGLRLLARRYPRARLVALDLAHGMLRRARRSLPWWRRLSSRLRPTCVCGDVECLPLKSAAVDLVWSNLTLQWVNRPDAAFREFRRVLTPGGLLMFTTFGPDTLKELRAAFAGVDGFSHVNRFVDMHDLGDMLIEAGFAAPVMDMEMVTLTYGEVGDLLRELKALGAHNVTAGRAPGLMGKRRFAAMVAAYEALRREGRLPATFEIVYGHAWVGEMSRGEERRVIKLVSAGVRGG